MQRHGIKHYKLNNPYLKNFKSTAMLLLLEMAQSLQQEEDWILFGKYRRPEIFPKTVRACFGNVAARVEHFPLTPVAKF